MLCNIGKKAFRRLPQPGVAGFFRQIGNGTVKVNGAHGMPNRFPLLCNRLVRLGVFSVIFGKNRLVFLIGAPLPDEKFRQIQVCLLYTSSPPSA